MVACLRTQYHGAMPNESDGHLMKLALEVAVDLLITGDTRYWA